MQKRVSSYHIVWNDFQSAIEYYTKAIELDPNNHVFYSNRAACYISLHQYNKALADSRRSIKINPKFVRAYQRKANALAGLFKYDEAIAAVGRGLKIEPNNDDLKNLAKELKIRLEQQKRNPHQKEPATPTTDLAILASTATPGSGVNKRDYMIVVRNHEELPQQIAANTHPLCIHTPRTLFLLFACYLLQKHLRL
eukprot:GEZU01027542.1.p1 GENE.GEZU01027542.1~~GEZU01027542.1.p1  ORF type:complete len:196 (+),score=35.40 GEZU01027542.1:193-780(+)